MSDDYYVSAKELVSRMTLEEKALLLTGDGWWATHRIDRLGIPSICLTDGPHGVRKGQGAGLVTSVPATCFPTASALSCSWDLDLLRRVGVKKLPAISEGTFTDEKLDEILQQVQ